MMRQYVSEYRMIDSTVPTNKGSAGASNLSTLTCKLIY